MVCLYTQLSSKDIRLEQLRKEMEVLMTAKQELDSRTCSNVCNLSILVCKYQFVCYLGKPE